MLSFPLRELRLSSVIASDEQAKRLCAGLTQLETLSINGQCDAVANDLQHLACIERLSCLHWMCDVKLPLAVVLRMRSLRRLTVFGDGVTNVQLTAIAKTLAELRYLSFRCAITPEKVEETFSTETMAAVGSLRHLKHLSVEYSDFIGLPASLADLSLFLALDTLTIECSFSHELEKLRVACRLRDSPTVKIIGKPVMC